MIFNKIEGKNYQQNENMVRNITTGERDKKKFEIILCRSINIRQIHYLFGACCLLGMKTNMKSFLSSYPTFYFLLLLFTNAISLSYLLQSFVHDFLPLKIYECTRQHSSHQFHSLNTSTCH